MDDESATTADTADAPGVSCLTAHAVRRWAGSSARILRLAQPVINQANVFPVADSDTGTNLFLTLTQGAQQLETAGDALGWDTASGGSVGWEEALRTFARGALVGARGNSGIIVAEFLRGFSLGATTSERHTARDDAAVVARGLRQASDSAYTAVGQPRQGTVLTAARRAAEDAAALPHGATVAEVVAAARDGAHEAMLQSAEELDVLAAAGVLDAGAYGLVLILDSLAGALSGADGMIHLMTSLTATRAQRSADASVGEPGARRQVGMADGSERVLPAQAASPEAVLAQDLGRGVAHTDVDGEFEVMCVVEHTGLSEDVEAVGPRLRTALQQAGDSVVVVGGVEVGQASDHRVSSGGADLPADLRTGLWHVHVHTDRPLDALRAVQRWEHRQVVVRCLPHQVAARAAGRRAKDGVVACTASPGLVMDLARAGAVVVLHGSRPPEVSDLLRAASETDSEHVVLLPADPQTLALVRSYLHTEGGQAGGHGRSEQGDLPALSVVPSTSDLHVVAAMSAWASAAGGLEPPPDHDRAPGPGEGADLREGDAHDALSSELAASVAAVRATTLDVSAAGSGPLTPPPALDRLLDHLAPGREAVLTVLAGDLVPARVLTDVTAHAYARVPGIDVIVLPSGRRSADLVLGADQL